MNQYWILNTRALPWLPSRHHGSKHGTDEPACQPGDCLQHKDYLVHRLIQAHLVFMKQTYVIQPGDCRQHTDKTV